MCVLKYSVASTLAYCIDLCLVKVSVALLLIRLTPITMKKIRLLLRTSIAVITVWSVVAFIILALQCRPLGAAWGAVPVEEATCLSATVLANSAFSVSVMDVVSSWFYAVSLFVSFRLWKSWACVTCRVDADSPLNSLYTMFTAPADLSPQRCTPWEKGQMVRPVCPGTGRLVRLLSLPISIVVGACLLKAMCMRDRSSIATLLRLKSLIDWARVAGTDNTEAEGQMCVTLT